MARVPIYAANWKMFKTLGESETFCHGFLNRPKVWDRAEVVIFSPFTALSTVRACLGGQGLHWGAQNMYPEASGAFTGEVSPAMLADLGCRWVLVGHSERRQIFKEADEFLRRKVQAAFNHGLLPNLCVGETEAERDAGNAQKVVVAQLKAALAETPPEDVSRMCVSYEPVWAIGTGRVATADQAQEMCAVVRQQIRSMHGTEAAGNIRVLYGGSVKPGNVAEIARQEDIDGALVGGASLEAESFHTLVTQALESVG